jgi:hypothetical protein
MPEQPYEDFVDSLEDAVAAMRARAAVLRPREHLRRPSQLEPIIITIGEPYPSPYDDLSGFEPYEVITPPRGGNRDG